MWHAIEVVVELRRLPVQEAGDVSAQTRACYPFASREGAVLGRHAPLALEDLLPDLKDERLNQEPFIFLNSTINK